MNIRIRLMAVGVVSVAAATLLLLPSGCTTTSKPATYTPYPTYTPLPSETPVNTYTPLPSGTAVNTYTPLPSLTAVNTYTYYPSWTATASVTASVTTSGTRTASATPDLSATTTATFSATATASASPSATGTTTATATASGTATVSATASASGTTTTTATSTATSTATATSSTTATTTSTSTVTNTPTPLCYAGCLYVTDRNSGNPELYVVSLGNNSVVATVSISNSGALAVAVHPNGSYVDFSTCASIEVVSTNTNVVQTAIGVPLACSSFFNHSLVYTPNGSLLYFADDSSFVTVVNAISNTVIGTAPAGGAARAAAISADGSRLYVVNTCNCGASTPTPASVDVLSVPSNTILATISLGNRLMGGIAVHPNGSFVYTTDANANAVLVIDTSSDTVVGTYGTGNQPTDIAITPNGSFLYVTNEGGGGGTTVSVLNSASGAPSTVSVGTWPRGVAIHPNGSFAYVTAGGSGTVSVIDTSSNTVVATANLSGVFANRIAVKP